VAHSLRTYPAECPSCKAETGHPIRVETVKGLMGVLRISLCCGTCQHRWEEIIPPE
jgi:C4-type Zn-finger protein